MKHVCTFVAASLFVLLPCATSQGALVTTTLTLLPPANGDNQLNVRLLAGGAEAGTATEVITSGSVDLEIEIDSSNVISSFRIVGGTYAAGGWTMATPFGELIKTVSEGTFVGSPSGITIDSGQITGGPIDDDDPLLLAGTPIPGVNDGSLIATPNGDLVDLRFELPLYLLAEDVEPGLDFEVSGTIVATGSITAVPEPSSFAALTVIGLAGVAVRRRRQRRALAPAATDA